MKSLVLRRSFLMAQTLLVGALVACGGGSDPVPIISGLAATGAGIPNASVTAKCAAGPELTSTTDSGGAYTLTLASGTQLPCMLKVTGGTPAITLFSFAQAEGRVNITPVTDLIVARALGSDPDTAFNSFDAATRTALNTGLASALNYVDMQMAAIVGSSVTDPLTGVFAVGDDTDRLLDALGAAVVAAGQSFAGVRNAAIADTSETTVPLVAPYLAAPTDVTATANSASQITLNWTAVPGATGYKVYRGTDSVDTAGLPLATPTEPTFVDTGLAATTAYSYKVLAVNSVVSGGGAASEIARATTPATSGGTGTVGDFTCDTSKFAPGAGVKAPTSTELAAFAKTYTGSEGDFDNEFNFSATGSATLVLNANGTATYNSDQVQFTSFCLDPLPNSTDYRLVMHAGDTAHFDLWPTGEWAGYTAGGKVVNDSVYTPPTGGPTLTGGVTFSKSFAGIDSLANGTARLDGIYQKWGDALESILVSVLISPLPSTDEFLVYVSVAKLGSTTLSAVLAQTSGGTCAVPNEYVTYKQCSSLGLTVDKTAGTITFVDTPLMDMVGTYGTFTMTGTLNLNQAN